MTVVGTRLDKWLFHAHFASTRGLAQPAVESGRVRLNGTRIDKTGHAVKPGNVLTLGKGAEILAIRVLALAERRGSAIGARALYEILEQLRAIRNCCGLNALASGADAP